MSIAQIGIVLEISGFILAGVFAAILLERGTVGRLSDWLSAWLASTSNSLHKGFPPPAPEALKTAAWLALMSILVGAAVATTTVGWLDDIPWAFWGGLAVIFLTLVLPLVMAFIWRKRFFPNVTNVPWVILESFGLYLFMLLIIIPMLLFTAGVQLLRLVVEALAGKDMLKKVLLVFGSLMLVAGLILELIATL